MSAEFRSDWLINLANNDNVWPMLQSGMYRHYKGKEYEVLFMAKHSETHDDLVVYRALYDDHQVWVRPLAMFLESVVVNGVSKPRFKRL